MTELLILRGPPASGKSTLATALSTHVRVNRDEIRYLMFRKYTGVDENVVTQAEDAMIEAALRAGKDTVVDATNLSNKFLKTKLSLASRYGATVVFRDFEVPMDVAIERDRLRTRAVGPDVIRKFYKTYKIDAFTGRLKPAPLALPTFEPYLVDITQPTAYIIDTDGTVANHEGVRNPYDTTRYHLDTPHEHVINVVKGLFGDHKIIGLSGRDAAFKDVTLQWWLDQGMMWDEFHMRPEGDTRMDAIIKYEMFKGKIEPYFNVLGAFDDRPQVIRMWRTIGVPVFDVGNGVEF